MSKISIIIPYYNSQNRIEKTIQSLFSQSYSNYEIIIVDDGSTQIFPVIDSTRIRYIRFEDNRGAAVARNVGLRAAEGNFIQFVDAGDTLSRDKLSKQISYLQQHPSVDFVFSDYKIIYEKYSFTEKVLFNACQKNAARSLLRGELLHLNAMLFRKDCILAVNGFDESLRQCEDWDLWIRLISCGYSCAHIPGCLTYYRKRQDSTSLTEDMVQWRMELEKMVKKRRQDSAFLQKVGFGRYVFFSNTYFLAAWRLHLKGYFKWAFKYYAKSFLYNPFIFVRSLIHLCIRAIRFMGAMFFISFKKIF